MTGMSMAEHERARRMADELRALNQAGSRVVRVEATLFDLFRIVGYLQLAWRHPGLDQDQRDTIERFARQLQDVLTSGETPELSLVLEQGWSREYDR